MITKVKLNFLTYVENEDEFTNIESFLSVVIQLDY